MSTKYAIIIPDGAADEPIDIFDGKTALQAANIPNIDQISIQGRQGTCRTIPPSLAAGSDVAQMCLLGYDPVEYYTGRAPLEAVAMDIDLAPDDWVFRCNLVTIADGLMADHSAGHITTGEAKTLIEELAESLDCDGLDLYTGVSYRHLCVIHNQNFKIKTQPPHDIIGEKIAKNMPKGKNSEMLIDIMARSQQLFENHEINRVRKDLGENPVSSVWLWGEGKKNRTGKFQSKIRSQRSRDNRCRSCAGNFKTDRL